MSRQWESTDKTVKKNVMKQGVFGKKPTECSKCNIIVENVEITGTSVEDLKNIYHSEIINDQHEQIVIIGDADSEIDRKIERAIQMMNTQETSLITISMPLQCNTETMTLKFEITLTKCVRYKPIWEWTLEEKYCIALRYKEKGVKLFKSCRYVDAFYKFSKACKILITLEPLTDLESDAGNPMASIINDVRLTLYNNMAKCQLNQKNFEHTVTLCTKVLDKDEKNVKALYRRGVAYGNLKNNEKAVEDLRKLLILEPNNPVIKQQFLIYNTKLQKAIQGSNEMVRRMFKI